MGAEDDQWRGVEEDAVAQERRLRPISMRTKIVVSGLSFFSIFLLICSAITPVVLDQLALLGLLAHSPDVEENDTGFEEVQTLRLLGFESSDGMFEREVGGTVNFDGEYAFINLQGESKELAPGSTALLSDFEQGKVDERDGYQWLYVTVDIRLKCSDDNKLESGEGGGARLWGLSDSVQKCEVSNFIWFWSCCNESDPGFAGFWAMVVVNGTQVFSQRLMHIDMREWHNYTIVWEEAAATFLVDGDVVAFSPSVPSAPMSARIQNVAYRYGTEGDKEVWEGFWGTPIELDNDQWIQVDYIHIYAHEDQINERSETMKQLLPLAAELIEGAAERRINTSKMRADHLEAKRQLETRDYVEPCLCRGMRSIVEHLEELSDLFVLAMEAVEAAEEAGEDTMIMRADYERAEATWRSYDYEATKLYLNRVAGIEG